MHFYYTLTRLVKYSIFFNELTSNLLYLVFIFSVGRLDLFGIVISYIIIILIVILILNRSEMYTANSLSLY